MTQNERPSWAEVIDILKRAMAPYTDFLAGEEETEPVPEEVGLHAEPEPEFPYKVGDLVQWTQPTVGEVTRAEPHWFEVSFWTEDGSDNTWTFDWFDEGHMFRRIKRPGE